MKTETTQKITNEIREQLRKPLPLEAVSPHPSKPYLSTIKAIYVVERLNDVFGVGGWSTKSTIIETTDKWVVVQTTLTIPQFGITLEAFGGNDNSDRGDAYKGAQTDCLTKMGSWLEIGIDVFKGGKADVKKPNNTSYSPSSPPPLPYKKKEVLIVEDRSLEGILNMPPYTTGSSNGGSVSFLSLSMELKGLKNDDELITWAQKMQTNRKTLNLVELSDLRVLYKKRQRELSKEMIS